VSPKPALHTKRVVQTFEYLASIDSQKTFTVISGFPANNNIKFKLVKGERCFSFETPSLTFTKNFRTSYREGYGFMVPFQIKHREENWTIPNGVDSINIQLGNALITNGEVWHIEKSFTKNDKIFFRAVFPKIREDKKCHYDFIESDNFQYQESYRAAGFISIQCGDVKLQLFDIQEGVSHYLIIDSTTSLLYEEFERILGAIIYSTGIISGNLTRSEIYILQSVNEQFNTFSGFHYRKLEESISSRMEVIDKRGLEFMVGYPVNALIPNSVFSKLITLAYTDKRYLRAFKTIAESNLYPLEIRASVYSVALETLKNIVIEENEKAVNPFKEKEYARDAIKKLLEIVKEMDDSKFNHKQGVLNKIEQLNQIGNSESFLKAFEIVEIDLLDADKKAIAMRNDFLHGRVPFENEIESIGNDQLRLITYKLHFLVTSLILKLAGYSGYVRNSPRYFSIITNSGKVDEPLFRKI
jgi:hypothetical protein